jgi:hypothetical protein
VKRVLLLAALCLAVGCARHFVVSPEEALAQDDLDWSVSSAPVEESDEEPGP